MKADRKDLGRIPIQSWEEREFTISVPWAPKRSTACVPASRTRTGKKGDQTLTIILPPHPRKHDSQQKPGRLGAMLALAAAMAAMSVHAETMTFNPVADTFINGVAVNNNAGGMPAFNVGRDGGNLGAPGIRRGLIKFNLDALPSGVVITSAVLQLKATRVPGFNAVDSSFDLLRINAAWNEGTNSRPNNGGAATAGESTWNARILGTANWTTPGALGEVAAPPSATVAVSATHNAIYSWSGPGMVADVQFWISNPLQNFGWLLKSQDEVNDRTVRGFGSRESADKPVLVLGYTQPGSSLMITGLTRVNGTNLAIFWSGGAGPFTVQRKDELSDSTWLEATVTNQSPAIVPQIGVVGFFRIEEGKGQPSGTSQVTPAEGVKDRPAVSH
jgi:hypothetical protein